jgi:hypothetical protein
MVAPPPSTDPTKEAPMRTTITCLVGAATLALAACGSGPAGTDTTATIGSDRSAATTATGSDTAIDRDARTIRYEGRDGRTALDLLREAGHDVRVTESSLGDYVTAIGDVEATGSGWWTFTANGKLPNVGADAYVTSTGEAIEWRFGS